MGGWNTVITQNTTLTPNVVEDAILKFEHYLKLFNSWLTLNKYGQIIEIGPRGSSYYFREDKKDNPYRIYGDVDYLIAFHGLHKNTNESHREYENRILKFYKDKFKEFFKAYPHEWINTIEDKYAIVNTEEGPVQIDILTSLPEYMDWMSKRYIPPKNLKGVVLGSLFSAINQSYNIMIGDRGVVIRIQDGNLVARKRKNVDIRTIAMDYNEFWADMFYWFSEYMLGSVVSYDNYFLENYKGISIGKNMLEQACFGLIGFCQSMEKAGMLGNNFFPEKYASEMLFKILSYYMEITRKQENHPKFEKAETKKAIQSAKKFKEDIKIGQEIVTRILS